MSLIAPDFVTPAAADYRHFTVSLVKTGRPLAEGIKIRFNTDAYGFDLSPGYEGFGMAPVESTLEALAGGGSVRTHRRMTAGDMFLPITIAAPSGERVDDMVAQLADIVTGNADGFFDVVVYNPHTGETRSRTVEYKSGLETQEWVSEERRAIGLTCTFLDPYWYGTAREVSRTLRPAIKPFITAKEGEYSFPFFPIFLADSTVQGEYILTVEGDSEVWPTWHITGPGRDVHITGPCGCEFIIEGDVTSPITVVTDPRRRAIFDDTGLIWDRVSKEHDEFFALQVGANKVSMTMVSGSPQSQITMSYRERWKTHLGGAGGGR